ncbi:high affinity copper uptake protein 1-like [Epargyreus clarus]|uniref:high affinity copper uptake protein 1-like n=1 Tax=Epargyreus clarus TaxID=520877 RepID=UPI003C2DEE07
MEDHNMMDHSKHETHMNHDMGNIMHGIHQMSANSSHDMMSDMSGILTTNDKFNHLNHEPDIKAHEHHMGHGDHSSHGEMSMTFHGGYDVTILFSWWNVTDLGEFIGSFLAIFIIAILYEGLKYYRKHLLWKTYTGLQYCAVAPPEKGVANICAADEPQVIQPVPHMLERNIPTMLSTAHAWQTFLHGIQVLVSYMLMLVFMTYNTWLCAAVVLGSATGYFLFGWRESVVVDFTEHCH